MTLSTEAEHAFGDEVDRAKEVASWDVNPEGRAEEVVLGYEHDPAATEDSPRVVDVKERAYQLRESVREDATDAAMPGADTRGVAEAAGRDMGRNAEEEFIDLVEASPLLAVRD